MGETTEAILARLDERFKAVERNIGEIKDGKMALCALHSQDLRDIKGALGLRKENGNGDSFAWSGRLGKFKAASTPAIIFACFVGLGVFQWLTTHATRVKVDKVATVVADGQVKAELAAKQALLEALKDRKPLLMIQEERK